MCCYIIWKWFSHFVIGSPSLTPTNEVAEGRAMDDHMTRLAIHSQEPKIILHGGGNGDNRP